MDDMSPLNPPVDKDAASCEALVDHYLAEMKRLQQQMAGDRDELLRLQAETRAILDDVMVTLTAA
jgi:hypothetical protein